MLQRFAECIGSESFNLLFWAHRIVSICTCLLLTFNITKVLHLYEACWKRFRIKTCHHFFEYHNPIRSYLQKWPSFTAYMYSSYDWLNPIIFATGDLQLGFCSCMSLENLGFQTWTQNPNAIVNKHRGEYLDHQTTQLIKYFLQDLLCAFMACVYCVCRRGEVIPESRHNLTFALNLKI